MLAVMLEISASMTQLNTRVYSIKETGLTSDVSLFTAFTKIYTKAYTAVHTKTHKGRFQIYPLWRAFSNLCVYGERFHRLRVDGRAKRLRLLAFAFTIVFVWTGP